MPYRASEDELDAGRLGDVWDVWKRPRTRLERPVLLALLDFVTAREGRAVDMPEGLLGRLKSSQVVPRRGLEVPTVAGVIGK
jgi:hypothetical protein